MIEISPPRRRSLGERRLSVDNEVNKENGSSEMSPRATGKSPLGRVGGGAFFKEDSEDGLDLERKYENIQRQYEELLEANDKLVKKNEMLGKEKKVLQGEKASLSQELGAYSNRITLMQKDHRSQKASFERERQELSGQVFQSQSLLASVKGTTIKKEKEMERLQMQLQKLTKDAQRGNKAVMQISKPLQKNLKQEKKVTVKDAVVTALEARIGGLEDENLALRSALMGVNKELSSIRSDVEQAHCKMSEVECIAGSQAAAKAAAAGSSQTLSSPGQMQMASLEGAVEARSVQWISEQLRKDLGNVQVRTARLHARCKDVREEISPVPSGDAAPSDVVKHLNSILDESLKIIEEQDKLILCALHARLPGMPVTVAASPVEQQHFAVVDADASPIEVSLSDEDLIPTSSPATMALLQSAGIVPISLSDDIEQEQ